MNIFSIVVGVVIQSLSTLELTVQRHFCSILKHGNSDAVKRTATAELRHRQIRLAAPFIPWLAYLRLRRYQSRRFLSVRVTTTI